MRAKGTGATSSLIVVVGLAACGGGGEGAERAVAAVDTVGGIEHVSYPAEAGPRLDWSVDTTAVIGDAFAEDAYQFNNVTAAGLAGDAEGNLYVLDRQGTRVLKYSPEGRHLATHGRRGEGPGELKSPGSLVIGPGDTIWVGDFANSRLTGFPQGGGTPRSVPYGDGVGVPSGILATLEGGGFVQHFRPVFNFRGGPGGMRRTFGPGEEEGGEPPKPMLPLLRLDPSAQPVDTLHAIPEPPTDMVQIETGNRMMIMMMSREFWPEFQWRAFSDGTVVVSDTAAYHLRFIAPDGDVERVLLRAPDPRAVTEADRERVRQATRDENEATMRIGGSGPDAATQRRITEQRLEKMTFADFVPRVVELRIDPLDRLWVGVSEEIPGEVARIDVYDRDGRLIGELRDFPMPDVFLGTDRVGVLRRDELDVQQVVILQLSEPAAG